MIFPTRIGTPEDPGNFRKDFLRTLEQAGLPMIRFHDLRHTAASIMLNRGVPAIVFSKRLGHAKTSTTLDIYGHLYMESQDETARIMDEILTPVLVTLPKTQGVDTKSQVANLPCLPAQSALLAPLKSKSAIWVDLPLYIRVFKVETPI